MAAGKTEGLQAPRYEGWLGSSLPPGVLVALAGVMVPIALAYGFATASELKVVAALAGVLGLLLVLARPAWGLLLFVALLYTRPEETVPELQGTRLSLIIAVATLIGLWFQLFLHREPYVRSPLNGMILGFGAAAVASTATLGNTSEAFQYIAKMVLLVLLVLNLVRTPERYRSFITAILIFTAYLAAYSIHLYHNGGALQQGDVERSQATGIFGDPNDLAGTIVAGLALLATRVRASRGFMRLVYLCLGVLYLAAILFTQSRSGMIALVAVAVAFPVAMAKRKTGAVVIAAILAGLLLTMGPSRMTSFDSSEASAAERWYYWSDAVMLFASHPVLGLGYNQFPEYNDGRVAHNTFVEAFADLGFVGYFFFMGCLYYCFRYRPRRGPDEAPPDDVGVREVLGARVALIGLLTSGFFITRTYIPVTYVLIALPVAAQVAHSADSQGISLKPPERFRDWTLIAVLCVVSIIGIKIMADALK